MTSGTVLFLDVSIVELVHLPEAGTCTVWAVETVTPLVSPGHAASHTWSISHSALIWQVMAAPLKCLLLLHIHAPGPHAAWMLWSTCAIWFSVCYGTIPGTQAGSPQAGCGGRRNLGFLVSAVVASPLLG